MRAPAGAAGLLVQACEQRVECGTELLPYLFDPAINLLAFAFSAAIGIVFGYFPARRAARLDPIEALRHE